MAAINDNSQTRWRAVIHYRSENGLIDVEHDFEELEELHGIVERGPSFCAVEKIEIFYMFADCVQTLEEAERA
jgi:hypothetical protein